MKIGDITIIKLESGPERPAIVTSVNEGGTVNLRLFTEPGDNPTNDGNFQTFLPSVKLDDAPPAPAAAPDPTTVTPPTEN